MTKGQAPTGTTKAIADVEVFDGSIGQLQKLFRGDIERHVKDSDFTYFAIRVRTRDQKIRPLLRETIENLLLLAVHPSTDVADKVMALTSRLVSIKELPSGHLLAEAKMAASAREEVLRSGDWWTSGDIAELAGFSRSNTSAQPNKWKRQGRIFAIQRNGIDYYPGYGLDPEDGYRPVKALAEVMKVFGRKKGSWGLAIWFASVNGFLGGARPQDLLGKDPERVVAAAQNAMLGIVHG